MDLYYLSPSSFSLLFCTKQVELTPVGANAPLSQNKYVQKFLSQSDQGIQLSILNVGNVKVCRNFI